MEERKIGEIFEVNGVKLRVVKDSFGITSCIGCYFHGSKLNMCGVQKCSPCEREDYQSVKFIKIGD